MPDRKTVRLTQARHGWAAKQSKAPQFRGAPLRHNAGVESRYVLALTALTAQMTAQVKREVIRLFKSDAATAHYAMDAAGPGPGANIGAQARILVNSLNQRFNALFAKKAGDLATQMVDGVEAASKTNLHASLKELTGGLSLKTSAMPKTLRAIYSASVQENVSLIKSIPQEYLQDVQGAVMRSITTGNGLQDLIPALEDYEGITHRRAKNIALDQTRKAYNVINRERMTDIGVKKFQWIHSGGGAVPRPDHVEMDGEIFSFDNLPVIDPRTGERGIPGQAINCRCTMAPVFDFSDVDNADPKGGYGATVNDE
jgi:SPP1 gp7 family putative phage head morphogenesis protein